MADGAARKTILVVDDEANLRSLLHTTLNDPDYRILEAVNGKDALAMARQERLDALVIDGRLPDLEGHKVAAALHLVPATARLPIILLADEPPPADEAQLHAPGTLICLLYPFSPLELVQRLEEALVATPGAGAVPWPAGIQTHLDGDGTQLARYARDLRQMVDAERLKARQLAEAHARLQILDRLKTDFLNFISHELRTPLVAMSAVEMLDPYGDPKLEASMLDIAKHGYARLQNFVTRGLRYFEWLARGRVQLTGSTDMAVLVRQAADQTKGLRAPDVDFTLSTPDRPCLVRGEPEPLGEVVGILLDNALKYSRDHARIRLQLDLEAAEVVLVVTDEGTGFDPPLAEELFRPFTSGDLEHHSRGSGISLALAAAIVESYNGRISAESTGPGRGARFTVSLPASPAPA